MERVGTPDLWASPIAGGHAELHHAARSGRGCQDSERRSPPSTTTQRLRSVFVGTPAFLGRIDGETQCAFWSEEPVDHDFDPELLIEIDLKLTPSAAAAKEISWEQVQVDDCFTGPNGVVAGRHSDRPGPNCGSPPRSIWSDASGRLCLPVGARPARRPG